MDTIKVNLKFSICEKIYNVSIYLLYIKSLKTYSCVGLENRGLERSLDF